MGMLLRRNRELNKASLTTQDMLNGAPKTKEEEVKVEPKKDAPPKTIKRGRPTKK